MIIQRLAAAIRRQDWFQVTIEIFIVVIGIFLGLQVSEWNEKREARIEERDYIERLVTELEATIAFNDGVILELDQSHNKLPLALDMVYSGRLSDENMEEFEGYFYSGVYFPHPTLQSSAITEMIATGKVAIISSVNIKNEIIRYNNAIIDQQTNITGQFTEFLNTRNEINENIRLAPDYWDSKKILDGPEEIINNRALMGKISFINEFQTKQLEQIGTFHEHTKELESLLRVHLQDTS